METPDIEKSNRQSWASAIRTRQLIYPDERVISFLAAHYGQTETNGERDALDIGYSTGRHLKLLLDYGFRVHGLDYLSDAAPITAALLGHEGRACDLRTADMSHMPFADGAMDVVLCWGVLFYRSVEGMLADLREIVRVLKPGGRVVVNFRGKECWFYGHGAAVAPGTTFMLDASAGPYANMRYTFLEREEALSLLETAGLTVENSEKVELWKRNCSERHSWWVFWARKPG